MGDNAQHAVPHVVQQTELVRYNEGMVPIAHLTMSTDPPKYDQTDAANFTADQTT
jgi:hypothetical protein